MSRRLAAWCASGYSRQVSADRSATGRLLTASMLALTLTGVSIHVSADVPARSLLRVLGGRSADPKAGPKAQSPTAPLGRHHAALTDPEGRLPLLVPLTAGRSAAEAGLLEVAPGMGAIHLKPSELASWLAAHPDLAPVTAPPRRLLLDQSNRWTHAPEFRQRTGFDGSGVVVGIVDTGLDVSHADFRDADGRTRVAWLMRRGAPLGLLAELEQAYGCSSATQTPCAIYGREDIDALLSDDPAAAPRDSVGHGTHVTSIAAGNGLSTPSNPLYAGVAPGATLIVASPSSGGGFSDPDIINSARFIYEQAEALGMPAVVNISLGSDFGPHDGTSALEKGLAALVGEGQPGRVMTVAAGNSGTLYYFEDGGPYGIHTEVHASDSVARVPISQPGASGSVSGSGFVWVGMRPGDEVSVGLEGPDGDEWIALAAPHEEGGYEDDDITAGVINNIVDERSQLTSDSNGAVVFWEGRWDGDATFAVLVQGHGDVQLWLTGTGGAAPGSTLGLVFDRAIKNGTIAVPASHPQLLAVGCTLNRTGWRSLLLSGRLELQSFGAMSPPVADSTCYFSAAGPTPDGSMKPDLLAPGGLVAAAMSRDADPRVDSSSIFNGPGCPDPSKPCYLVDDTHALSSGTSMSAPFVAGAAALLLQAEPNLTQGQAMEILTAGAARPTGVVPYEFQQGPGELDLLGALQVLEERTGGSGGVDLGRSWYVLASPYLRPDPSWAVQGVIELRHQDGAVAMEVPASRLKLRLRGAVEAVPLTRVRAGLYRFAVAAPQGSGGTVATVEVLYEGMSLGKRELPVGVDSWAASGGVQPVGGCALQPPGRGSQAPVIGLLLGLSWRWRRRARRRAT